MLSRQICMFYGSKSDFIRVICNEKDKRKLESMGWALNPMLLFTEESKPEPKDEPAELVPVWTEEFEEVSQPEITDDEPMSGEALKEAIMDAIDKDAVIGLMKIQRRETIDRRGSLERVKEKALAVIDGEG